MKRLLSPYLIMLFLAACQPPDEPPAADQQPGGHALDPTETFAVVQQPLGNTTNNDPRVIEQITLDYAPTATSLFVSFGPWGPEFSPFYPVAGIASRWQQYVGSSWVNLPIAFDPGVQNGGGTQPVAPFCDGVNCPVQPMLATSTWTMTERVAKSYGWVRRVYSVLCPNHFYYTSAIWAGAAVNVNTTATTIQSGILVPGIWKDPTLWKNVAALCGVANEGFDPHQYDVCFADPHKRFCFFWPGAGSCQFPHCGP